MQTKNPPLPLPAATLILARDRQERLEIYLLRRKSTSSFMGGFYVFPGGVVETKDGDLVKWGKYLDLTPVRIAEQLGGDGIDDEIAAYALAAIRETLEEAGVLMATASGQAGESISGLDQQIMTLLREDFFAGMASRGWRLHIGALRRWAHWITPRRMRRRFDTRFFVAPMPAKQHCRPDGIETDHGVWIRPLDALAANLAEQMPLSPPTIVTLQQLTALENMAQLGAHALERRWQDPIRPRLVSYQTGALILEPWDPDYGADPIDIDLADPGRRVLSAGESFSRLWFNGRVWQPVGSRSDPSKY